MIKVYGVIVERINKTIEVIDFAMQLSAALQQGTIRPEHLGAVVVDRGDAEFMVERDWLKSEEYLKKDFADITKIAIVSYQIIICKEAYWRAFLKKEQGGLGLQKPEKNTDLHGAQMILNVVRNALGHMTCKNGELSAMAYWDHEDKKGNDKFEVKSIGVALDTRGLKEEVFSWEQMGGIKNFKKVLKFLAEDMQKRIEDSV